MRLAKGHKEGLAFAEKLRCAIPRDACGALNNGPVFGAMQVVAGGQGTPRFDPVAAHLIAVARVKPGAGGPGCAGNDPDRACCRKISSESTVHDCHPDPLAAKVAGKWLGKR